MIEFLRGLSWPAAAGLLALENIGIVGLVAAVGGLLRSRTEADRPPPLTRAEVALAAVVVLVNTAVTLLGWDLWRRGVIRVRTDLGWPMAADILVLLLAMDLAMYLLHRAAHHPVIYPRLHAIHHRYERPRPLTLFVMHPLEAAGFGALWLGLLCVYAPTWAGMSAYLAINVASGTIGHLGSAAAPSRGPFAGADFHGAHHRDPSVNFGFYSRIWDRLFRTQGKAGGRTSS